VICNVDSMPSLDTLHANVRAIFDQATEAVNGDRAVYRALREEAPAGPVALLAVGKAAVSMSRGAIRALGQRIDRALVITKHGYEGDLPWPVLVAGHPMPDEASIAAGEAVGRLVADLPQGHTVLVLLSGGASSLIEWLPEGVTLRQLQDLNQWLLGAGLDIAAMNAIRSRVSRLKGGRLALLLAPRPVYCLAISDVPGDEPGLIGSGPLTARRQALALPEVPDSLRSLVDRAPAAPAASDPAFGAVRFRIVAGIGGAMAAAAAAARTLGYDADPARELLGGDAIAAGERLARELLERPPGCVRIHGGETTLALPSSPGQGGRNQSLALSAARVLDGARDCVLLAAGTDGTDGPGTDAGALVDGDTIRRGREAGLNAEDALRRADAGRFLEASGDLVRTGPTGTNVMDLCIGLRL
jgi:glycerate 2-kinase